MKKKERDKTKKGIEIVIRGNMCIRSVKFMKLSMSRVFLIYRSNVYIRIYLFFFFFFSNPRGCLNIHRASSRKITFAEMRVLLLRPHEILYSAATQGCRRRAVP